MTRQRYKLIKQCFGSVLEKHGLTSEGSNKGVFWRKTENGIYHYIAAWRALSKPKYDIRTLASFD